MCGDFELNPGQEDSAAIAELQHIGIEANQTSMSQAIAELKLARRSVSSAMNDLKECLKEIYDTRQTLNRIKNEAAGFRTCLDNAEDQSRRDNLAFRGLADSASETDVGLKKTLSHLFPTSWNYAYR